MRLRKRHPESVSVDGPFPDTRVPHRAFTGRVQVVGAAAGRQLPDAIQQAVETPPEGGRRFSRTPAGRRLAVAPPPETPTGAHHGLSGARPLSPAGDVRDASGVTAARSGTSRAGERATALVRRARPYGRTP